MVEGKVDLWSKLKEVLKNRINIYRDDQKNLLARKSVQMSMQARERALACKQTLDDMKELEEE